MDANATPNASRPNTNRLHGGGLKTSTVLAQQKSLAKP